MCYSFKDHVTHDRPVLIVFSARFYILHDLMLIIFQGDSKP
jgi:hypothetical protein